MKQIFQNVYCIYMSVGTASETRFFKVYVCLLRQPVKQIFQSVYIYLLGQSVKQGVESVCMFIGATCKTNTHIQISEEFVEKTCLYFLRGG